MTAFGLKVALGGHCPRGSRADLCQGAERKKWQGTFVAQQFQRRGGPPPRAAAVLQLMGCAASRDPGTYLVSQPVGVKQAIAPGSIAHRDYLELLAYPAKGSSLRTADASAAPPPR